MRRVSVVLGVLGLLCLTVGCGDGGGPATSPSPPGSGAQAPPPTGSPPTSTSTPSDGAGQPPPATTAPPATAAPPIATTAPAATAFPAPSGGEVPGGLPWGGRTLTGTVERDGDCLMLLVGARRWALTGDAVRGLTAGQRVTVQGALTTRPAACGDRELAQTVAVTRVAPA